MTDASRLIHELDTSIAHASPAQAEHALRRVTDLFLAAADSFGHEQIELFDLVIARLAVAIEARGSYFPMLKFLDQILGTVDHRFAG